MTTRLTGSGIIFNDSTTLSSKYGIFPQTTMTIFFESSAPVGWAKSTAHNNKALRVVSGTGGGIFGSTPFTTVFASQPISGPITVTGTVNNEALSVSEIASHSHPASTGPAGSHQHSYIGVEGASPNGQTPGGGPRTINSSPPFNPNGVDTNQSPADWNNHGHSVPIGSTGSSLPLAVHNHPWSGSAPLSTSLDFEVAYIDVILCSFT